jgi:hypothetical protein
VRCEVRVEIEETAEHKYRLRGTVFAVRCAFRWKKQQSISIGCVALFSL